MTQPTVTSGQPIPWPVGFESRLYNTTEDGAGNITAGTYGGIVDGANLATTSFTGTYNITSSGTLFVATNPNALPTLPNGSVLLNPNVGIGIQGDFATGSIPVLHIGAPKGTGFTNASLNGTYAIGTIEIDPTAQQPNLPASGTMPALAGFRSSYTLAKFDGAGNFTLSNQQHLTSTADGTISAATTGSNNSGAYSVASDGTVTVSATNLQAGSVHLYIVPGDNVLLVVRDGALTGQVLTEFFGIGIKLGSNESVANLVGNYASVHSNTSRVWQPARTRFRRQAAPSRYPKGSMVPTRLSPWMAPARSPAG